LVTIMARTFVAKQQTTSGGTIGGYYRDQTPSAPTPSPTPTPATPTSQATTSAPQGEYFPRYTSSEQSAESYLSDFKAPQSEEAIYTNKAQQAQGEIDALNKLYDSKLQEQAVINEGRNRQTSSVNTLTGLGGSTEANVQVGKTDTLNKKENDLINNERAAAISSIFSKVRSEAVQESQFQRQEARMNAEQIMSTRKARQEEAAKNLTMLAQSGVTIEGLKKSDPQSYEFFAKQMGGEQILQAMMTLNRPQDTILDKKMQGGKYIISYQNPLTGKVRIETVDLGLPPEYSQSVDTGDRLLFMPDGWDGDPSKLITINKGMTPQQAADAAKIGDAPVLKETAGERNALGFFIRGKDALDTIKGIESSIASKNLAGQTRLEFAPNFLQSQENQVYRQLQRQFTEARLRKESGAAIPPAEYVSDAQTYFAQPGDTKETLARKEAARAKVLESLRVSSGNAYKNYYNDPGNQAPTQEATIVTAPDGTEVEIID
jgi:hypothetical protein